MSSQKKHLETLAVENFQEYLKIPSVHPNVNYDNCVIFLKKQAKSLGLPINVHYLVPNKPIVVLTWTGTNPALPSILLNSHMDVVPVYPDKWTHDPFRAHIENNRIYGRGTQDMKSVGIQHLEAVRRLKLNGVTLKRTIHVSFVPDEEIGGEQGMKIFVQSKIFRDLNIGVAFDESAASPIEPFVLFYGERSVWQFHVHFPGNPGHGSILLENTAGEKATKFLMKIFEFRRQQAQLLKDNPSWEWAAVTSVNLTKMNGGVQTNVIPPEFVLSFDTRIPPETDLQKWEQTLNKWCEEAGSGVWMEFEQKQPLVASTKLDSSNIFWMGFKETAEKRGWKVNPQICPGGTDARYVRGVGIPAIGFSPMNNTEILLHNHNEYLSVETFLKGIEIFYEILSCIGNKTE